MKLLNDFDISKVDVTRKVKFKNSKVIWQGVPLVMSPLPICSTIEVAKALPNALTFVSDEYEVDELYAFYFEGRPNAIYKLNSLSKFQNLMGKLPKGYLQHVFIQTDDINRGVELVEYVRKKHRNITIWYDADGEDNLTTIDNVTQRGVDVVFCSKWDREIVKVREGYDVNDCGDFIQIKITEGFEEFKGETDGNLNRVFENFSVPFSENTLEFFYNNQVEEFRKRLFTHGCRTVEIYSNFAEK